MVLIAGIALRNIEVQTQTQRQVNNGGMCAGNDILGAVWNQHNTSHYTKLEFPQFSGEGLD